MKSEDVTFTYIYIFGTDDGLLLKTDEPYMITKKSDFDYYKKRLGNGSLKETLNTMDNIEGFFMLTALFIVKLKVSNIFNISEIHNSFIGNPLTKTGIYCLIDEEHKRKAITDRHITTPHINLNPKNIEREVYLPRYSKTLSDYHKNKLEQISEDVNARVYLES